VALAVTSAETPADPLARGAALAANLAAVEARIAAACKSAGRARSEVTLVAVSKTFPASDVVLLAGLGVLDVGENRDQEAAPKATEVAALRDASAPVLRWHFIGALQTNKCASVARYASVVHSVDRPRLVAALGAAARTTGRRLRCLVQVDLDDGRRPGRSGALPADVDVMAAAVSAQSGLELAGVMAVAPLGADPGAAFRRLAEVAAVVRRRYPDADMISAGMSADFEAAIAHGSTHVRVGAALLGVRRPQVG
jgi:pyridoxal phosphate enzyme (YggS family)